mmetsp:Transcript_49529/g.78426  ORF Transcript_49529/g.78426 Transcript_49529/m.78426 type:complete len:147 (-) Transcript_49529:383-823(-)
MNVATSLKEKDLREESRTLAELNYQSSVPPHNPRNGKLMRLITQRQIIGQSDTLRDGTDADLLLNLPDAPEGTRIDSSARVDPRLAEDAILPPDCDAVHTLFPSEASACDPDEPAKGGSMEGRAGTRFRYLMRILLEPLSIFAELS